MAVKSAKAKTQYVCVECGAEYPKWQGKCSQCGNWNTLEERQVAISEIKASRQLIAADTAEITTLGSEEIVEQNAARMSVGFSEFDNVVGGGIVEDQVILLSGEPGIGKSTLLLQIVSNLYKRGHSVLYVSGEESLGQINNRSRRLFSDVSQYEGISFVNSAGVYNLIEQLRTAKPEVVVVDSIQTIYDEQLNSLPGSIMQVKSCASLLVRAAKQLGFVLVMVGHINKEGSIAGPKVLEHLVDTILQFEGEQGGEYRLLRVLKNRFGPTGEVGLFAMEEKGLRDMSAGVNLFAGDDADAIGAARTVVFEGSRPLVVQVQALTSKTVFAYPKRVAEGVNAARLQLLCAIMEKYSGISLGDQDVYVRVSGGYKLGSPAADLAIIKAIDSSLRKYEVAADTAFLGEVGLNGRVFLSQGLESRLGSMARFGLTKVVTGNLKNPPQKAKEMKIEQIGLLSKL